MMQGEMWLEVLDLCQFSIRFAAECVASTYCSAELKSDWVYFRRW